MNHVGEITSVVEDHVEGLASGEGSQGLLNTPEVFLLGLALPGKDGDTGRGDADAKSGKNTWAYKEILTQRRRGLGWRRCSARGGLDERLQYCGIITNARRPGDFSTKSGQGLDEHGGLNGPGERMSGLVNFR